MHNIGVLGAGTMGSGIANIAARNAYKVTLVDINKGNLEKGIAKIEKRLQKDIEKERLTFTEKDDILSRLNTSRKIEDLADMDLIIEAAIEDLTIKKSIFSKLDKITNKECILGTNTSALSITEIAAATTRPDRVIGIHFFNPVGIMKLVEVIRTASTSEESYSKVDKFVVRIDKKSVEVKEAPGFVVNRLLIPMINEAIYLLQEGVASIEDIDIAMKLGANYPLGPLALADLIGLDVCLAIMKTLHEELGDDKYRPCPLLKKKVRAGYLGRKTNNGFYEYK